MAAMNFVSELKPFKNMWKIQVKIIRLWKQYSAAGGETIEMVFVDARGDKIAGTVKRELVGQFNRVLQEGDTKVIINFSVTNSGGSYRPSKHPFKIVFLPTTRVRICEDLPNNLTGLNPVNFGDVLNGVLDDDYLVDVIGQIVEVTQKP
ncbi:PREDICTED: replication factor A protein 1-like [Brassica oleracea var. oleracea]|uniref:replication factor A protein 1-like n=1 Tax=Brassica oleracea var. oleracea TaxID=109376 RepID=UPI0006A6B009|nr:PREDICTED: replication factor A protein 1-like [Brassica oleracea var. oleracea]